MTDLEQHVNAPGRDKLVKEVKDKIDALGIRYVYFNLFQLLVVLSVKVFLVVTGNVWLKKVFN